MSSENTIETPKTESKQRPGRGRPKKYFTDEDRKLAINERQRLYREKRRDEIKQLEELVVLLTEEQQKEHSDPGSNQETDDTPVSKSDSLEYRIEEWTHCYNEFRKLLEDHLKQFPK